MAGLPGGAAAQKEALKILEHMNQQLNSMKAKIVYACGEWALLSSDEGRSYFTRVIKTLDDDHRAIRSGWPRLQAAMQVAKACTAQQQQQQAALAAAPGGGPAPAGSSGGGRADEATRKAVAVQRYGQAVLQQLGEALVDALSAEAAPAPAGPSTAGAGAAAGLPVSSGSERPAKRQRTLGSPGALPLRSPLMLPPPGPAPARGLELLGVLQRLRELQAGLVLQAVDDGGNALGAELVAAADGSAGSYSRGAERLRAATEVRLLCPKAFCACVLLEGPGQAAALRVVVDSADKAANLDPWAMPTTQVFRRVSALATRVLAYYQRRAPLELSTGALPNTSPASAALEDLLLWLATYRDLFSKKCAATGRLMAWDPSVQYPVPPVFRPFKFPRQELRLRAEDLSRVAAYHMHVAPIELLGWEEDVPAQVAQEA